MATVANNIKIAALYSAVFNRAPDQEGLDFWLAQLDGGASLVDAAVGFTLHPVFTETYGDMTSIEFVQALYMNVLGSAGDAAGIQYWVDRLATGESRGEIVASFVEGALTIDLAALLAAGELSQADYDAAVVRQNSLTNKATVGVYFAETFGAASNLSADTDATTKEGLESDPIYLASQAAIAKVTDAAASVDTAKSSIDTAATAEDPAAALIAANQPDPVVGETFTLTNGTDTATANVFSAGQVYTPGGNDRINSLQDEDVLTGTGTNPTLNLTLGNTNDNGSPIVTPTLNGIQTINAVFSNTDSTGLDLQDASGLVNVDVTRVSAGGAQVLNMPATAVNLTAKDSSDFSNVTLSYRDAQLVGEQTVNLAISNVLANALVVGAQNNTIAQQIDTLNLTVDSLSIVRSLDTREDGLAATNQTLNITANADFVLGADVDDDGDVIDDGNALVDGSGISAITVTGAGNVSLGEVGTADDVVGNGVVDAFTLDASAATGNIAANISNSAGDAQSSFTTGSGADRLLAGTLAVDANNDGVEDLGYVRQNLAADVVTGAGADTVQISGSLQTTGSILTGDGDDNVVVQGQMAGSVVGGGTIDLGAGDDTLVLGKRDITNDISTVSVAEEANVLAGDGNDTVIMTGSMAGDTAGDTDDDLGANVDMGAGDDTVIFDLTNQNDLGTLIGGTLVGGEGVNTLTVTGNATVLQVADYDPTANPAADAVTGFSTLNLVSEQAYSARLAAQINGVVANTVVRNDAEVDAVGALANTQTADYTVDVSEFTGLTTINLENQAGVTTVAENNAFAGDAATYALNNLAGTEAVTLTTVEGATGVTATRGVGGITQAQIAADVTADATLTVSLADATAANQTFAATLNGNGDVAINDVAAAQYAQVTLATQTNEIENLNLTIGGDTSRSILLQDSHFEGTLTLGGTNTQTITVGAVWAAGALAAPVDLITGAQLAASASTVTSTLTGSVNLTVSDDEAHTITMAADGGNDVVNLLNDTLTTADTINLGGGTADRIIINDDIRGLAADTDAVFKTISGVEQLELRGVDALGGSIDVSLDNDALATGIDTIVVDLGTDGTADGQEANVDLNIDAAFTRALTISMANESTLDIDNKGNGNLDITIAGREGVTRTLGDAAFTTLALTDAGTNNVVNITINTANVAQTVSDAAAGANDIRLTNNATGADLTPGDIDRITLRDSNSNLNAAVATPANPYATQTGAITVTGSAQWAQAGDTLVVDASDINDDDGTALDEAGDLINEDTQTVVLNFAGMNYAVNLVGSEMNNGPTVLAADVFLQAAFDDVLIGGNVADTISGGGGQDWIQGGTGGDTLTGGAQADTFVYTAAADSNAAPNSLDTITDFVSGTDKIRITLNASNADVQPAGAPDGIIDSVVNASSFSVVNNAGGGDNSLAGNNTTNNALVIGDAYYSTADGQLAVDMDGDGDITTANDLVVNVGAVAASDLQFVINGTGANDVIRGGQGQDDIQAGAGNDTIVLLGTLSATEAAQYSTAGAGIINATVGRVLAFNELLSARTATEAVAGEKIDGGAGAGDTLEVFGTVNLAQMTLANIENLVVNSSVTLTDAQLAGFTSVVLSGNTPHTITVTNTTGAADTVAAILAKLSIVGAGANTTVSITGTDGVLVADWNVANARLEVTSNTSGTAAAAGTAFTALPGVVSLENGTYATAKTLFAIGDTGYTITDTLANVAAAVVADGAAAVNAVLAAAAASSVTLTDVSGNVSVPGYTEANVDFYQLLDGGNATMSVAQAAKINAATGTNNLTLSDLATGQAITSAVETVTLATGANEIATSGAQNVSEGAAGATTLNVSGTYIGTFTSAGTNDKVALADGADIKGATIHADAIDLTIATGGSVTMTQGQHQAFSGTVTAAGVGVGGETVALSTAGVVTARAAVENYNLSAAGNAITVNNATNVTGGAGADTIQAQGGAALTGTYTGLAAADTIDLNATGSIAGVNQGEATGAGILDIAAFAAINVSMTAAQYNGFTTINGNGTDDTITLTTADTVATALAGGSSVRTFSVVEGSDVTLGTAAGELAMVVTETGAVGTVSTFTLGNGTYAGVWTGIDAADVVKVGTTTDISGNTGLDAGVVIDFQNAATAGTGLTLNATQNDVVTFTNTTGNQKITVSAIDTFTVADGIEAYDVVAGSDVTVTATNANVNVTGTAAAAASTIRIGGNTVAGTWNLQDTGTADVLVATDGANIAGVNLGAATTAENLTLTGGITMTAAQFAGLNVGITAAGTSDGVTLTSSGAHGTINTALESITFNGAGVDTATFGLANGDDGVSNDQASVAVSLAGSGADVITIDNTSIDTGAKVINITGFGNDDKIVSALNGATISSGPFLNNQSAAAIGALGNVASTVLEIDAAAATFGTLTGSAAVLAWLGGAGLVAAGGATITVVAYNGNGTAGIYQLIEDSGGAGTAFDKIELVGTVNAVDNALVAANFA